MHYLAKHFQVAGCQAACEASPTCRAISTNNRSGSDTGSTRFELNHTTLRYWYTASQKHVHVVKGLQLQGSNAAVPPCTEGTRSRWIYTIKGTA